MGKPLERIKAIWSDPSVAPAIYYSCPIILITCKTIYFKINTVKLPHLLPF